MPKRSLTRCPLCGEKHGITRKEQKENKSGEFKCKNCNRKLKKSEYGILPYRWKTSLLWSIPAGLSILGTINYSWLGAVMTVFKNRFLPGGMLLAFLVLIIVLGGYSFSDWCPAVMIPINTYEKKETKQISILRFLSSVYVWSAWMYIIGKPFGIFENFFFEWGRVLFRKFPF